METILMTQLQFINLLVSSNFASRYEAEQYTYACGSTEWCYLNRFTKDHANSNEDGSISIYKFDPSVESHNKCLINKAA